MRKTIQRWVATAFAAALASSILTACSKSEAKRDAPGVSSKPIVLRVWQTETDREALKVLDEIRVEFEKRNPGVQVQIESVAWSSLSAKLTAAIASNNPPDLAHLEPFMVAAVYHRGLLLPMRDLIEKIEKESGDTIFPTVRELQHFNGEYYGIAYAVGTTGWAYRRDLAEQLRLKTPRTWAEYVRFAKAMADHGGDGGQVLLPGGDPFFVDQLVAELLANNGGRLFNPQTNRPELDQRPFIETLQFFKSLGPYIDPGWMTQKYLDQFNRLAHGDAANVPVSYARASRAIEAGARDLSASPEVFAWMEQPRGPSSTGLPVATIDCEPFVIFRAAASRPAGNGKSNADLARDFLLLFYSRDFYLKFVRTVPIHLTPIFQKMASDPAYLNAPLLQKWKPWHDQTVAFLSHPEQTRPILMPDASPAAKAAPYLLEFQSRRVLTQAVVDVLVAEMTPEQAARNAQAAAERLVESAGLRSW